MTNLANPLEYLEEAKSAFQRGKYNPASALCRSALETSMKHRVSKILPDIDVNNYHDIPGIKALNDILLDNDADYSTFIYNEIKYMTIQIGNLATHGSKTIPKKDTFYFISRLDSLIKSILLPMTDKKSRVAWWRKKESLNQYRKYWGNYLSKQVDHKSIEDFNSSYIDIDISILQLSKPKHFEPPLTELRTYKVPIMPIIPFFNFPYRQNIISQFLDRQGIDKFEKPFAEWKMKLGSELEIFGGEKRDTKKTSNNNNSIKWVNFIQNTSYHRSWVLGEAGSGKSYLARKCWDFFIDILKDKRNENVPIPLFIDFSKKDTNETLETVFNTKFIDTFNFSRFIRILTKDSTYYNLPIEDDNENCSILLIIDSIDELTDLSILNKLMELISAKKIPFLAFSRPSALKDLKTWILPSHNILRIESPDDNFIQAMLSKDQIELFHTIPISFRNQIKLPIFLQLFSVYSESLAGLKKVQSRGEFLFFILKALLKRGVEKKLGILSSTHYQNSESILIKKIASLVAITIDSVSKIGKLTDVNISLYNKDVNLKQILIDSGLFIEDSFRHELFKEILYVYYLLTQPLSEISTKHVTESILCLCKELYISKEISSEKVVHENIKTVFTFSSNKFPMIIAENYFSNCLKKETEVKLIDQIMEIFLYRKLPRYDPTTLNFFRSINDQPIISVHPAIRILSNKAFYDRVSQHKHFKYVFENLIQSLKPQSNLDFDFSGIKDFFLLKMLFNEHSIPKSNIIKICGKTRDIRASKLLCEFLEKDLSIYTMDEIKEALVDIGVGSELLLTDHITSTSNINKKFVLYDVIAEFRSDYLFNFLLENYKNEKDIYIRSRIIKGLLKYSNKETNSLICENFFNSSNIDQKILLTVFYQFACPEFIESLTHARIQELYNLNDYYFTKTLKENINLIRKDIVEFIIKDYNVLGEVEIYVLNFLIEYGKLSPENEQYTVNKLLKWGEKKQRRLITYLQQLNGYCSIKAILNIIQSEGVEKNKHILYRLVTLKRRVIQPIFENLKETNNTDYAFELIRLVGLLGYSDYLEEFLQLKIINQEKLSEISSWAIMRMGLRKPEILAKKVIDNLKSVSNLVLNACMLINDSQTKKSLFYAFNNLEETEIKVNIATSLLFFGDESIIPQCLTLLDMNISNELKSNIIFGLRFTRNKNVQDYLEKYFEEKSPLFKQTLFTLTELKNIKAEKYWVTKLTNSEIKVDLKTFYWLTRTIPSRKLLPIAEVFVHSMKINFITSKLTALKKDIDIESLIQECPEILEIPLIVDNTAIENIRKSLLDNEIIFEGPIQEKIKRGNLMAFTSYVDFYHYFTVFQEDFLRSDFFLYSKTISNLVKGKKEDFFDYVISLKSEILQLLVVLSCEYLDTIETVNFLSNLLQNMDMNPVIQREAKQVLLKYYSRNIQKLTEIKVQLKDEDLLSIVKFMNPTNRDCQSFCKELVHETVNPRLKFQSALKTLRIHLITKTIEEVFDDLKNKEYEIKEILRIIHQFKLGNMLEKVLEIYETTNSRFLQQDCLNIFKEICNPILTTKLIKNLKQKNALFTDNYDLRQIIEKHLNRFVLDEILGDTDFFNDKIEKSDILNLLIKNKDPKYWKVIVSLLKSIDIAENKFSLYALDDFMQFIDPELLEPVYQSEKNSDAKDFLIKSFILSGRSKYLEWWIAKLKDSLTEIPQIRIFGSFQIEFFKNFILTEKSMEIKKRALERIWFERDILALSFLIGLLKKEKSTETKEIIIEKIDNIII